MSIILALIIGIGSVFLLFHIQQRTTMAVTNGPWNTRRMSANEISGLYTIAMVAVYGPLGLKPSESIYYHAATDSKGERLNQNCTYKIEGQNLPTRWWNITAYKDFDWIPNTINRWSYSSTNIRYDSRNKWAIKLSPEQQNGNWLPSGDTKGDLFVTLRFYNPEPEAIQNLDTISLPTITKEKCK